MGKTKQANQKEYGKGKDGLSYPKEMMQAIIKKGSKNHHLIACFDGEDKIELYKDIEEQHWVGTYDLMDKRVTYFVTKNSPKSPDIKRYSLTIPKIELICKEFVAERVDW